MGLSTVCNIRKGQRAVQASINAATSAKLRTFRDTKDKVFSTKVTRHIQLGMTFCTYIFRCYTYHFDFVDFVELEWC